MCVAFVNGVAFQKFHSFRNGISSHLRLVNRSDKKLFFTKQLLAWHKKNKRVLPWKGTNDPYKIWLSEIILQQTRIEQGKPYYLRLTELFPTVHHLANTSEDKLMKAWQGLGYYSRARNLHHTAKHIANNLGGKFPSTYNTILELKGIGPYTAAAISSFAFNEPAAVVDGNVYRVLARYFGIYTPIDSTDGKKEFTVLANELIDRKNPGGFNQAIMDFGATLCKPALPECYRCPLKKECVALKNDEVNDLPVKAKKLKVRERFFHFLVIRNGKGFYIEKRHAKDIWKGLYQFPMVEEKRFLSERQLLKTPALNPLIDGKKIKWLQASEEQQQLLSHQLIRAKFFEFKGNPDKSRGLLLCSKRRTGQFAFPKIVDEYIKNCLL